MTRKMKLAPIQKSHGPGAARRGGMLVLLAILLPVAIILAAFAINIAWMELGRTELFIASDAAARAGGRQFVLTNDQNAAKVTARDAASRNPVAGQPLHLNDSDFVFGQSTRTALNQRFNFTAGGGHPNALQLLGNRGTSSADGPIPLLLPNILGRSSFATQQMARSTQLDIDVAIVLDRSGSMAYAATEPAVWPPAPAAAPSGWQFGDHVPPHSRWLNAVNAVDAFIVEMSQSPANELVALVTYNGGASIDQPLTTNYGLLDSAMDVYTQNYNSGATNIEAGIIQGVNSFATPTAKPWAAKVIILLTDGIVNAGGDPVVAAQNAANQKITIFTISFALEADQALMQDIATVGQGKHYHASTGGSLATVFQDIARNLPILLTQ